MTKNGLQNVQKMQMENRKDSQKLWKMHSQSCRNTTENKSQMGSKWTHSRSRSETCRRVGSPWCWESKNQKQRNCTIHSKRLSRTYRQTADRHRISKLCRKLYRSVSSRKRTFNKEKWKSLHPTNVDSDGNVITTTEEQLEAWAIFLESKLSARPEDPEFQTQLDDENEDEVPEPAFDEVKTCIKKMKKG